MTIEFETDIEGYENTVLRKELGKWNLYIDGKLKNLNKVLEAGMDERLCFLIKEQIDLRDGPVGNLTEEEVSRGYVEGGYDALKERIQDAPYEDVGEQKEIKLEKPGRRIKNLQSELMEGGTIRAGEKVLSSNGKPIPSKTDYFIITTKTRKNAADKNQPDMGYEKDQEIHSIVGDKPRKLKVRLACDREDLNFITYYGKYKSAMCECRGDGYSAETSNGVLIPCLGEECESFKKKECKKHGVLSVILEDSPRFGIIYKFRTTSRNSISFLDASIALLTSGLNGHIAGAPLWLRLTPKETTIPDGTQKGKRTTVYVANLEFRGNHKDMEIYLQRLLAERNGRDPIKSVERIMEASLELPESPDEQKDIQETFHPEGVA